jgi:hypothetical protein
VDLGRLLNGGFNWWILVRTVALYVDVMPTRTMVECLLVRYRTAELLYPLLGAITGGSPGTTYALLLGFQPCFSRQMALYNVNAPDHIPAFGCTDAQQSIHLGNGIVDGGGHFPTFTFLRSVPLLDDVL